MKNALSLALLCFLFFPSCKKFEDGQNFRLRTAKQILCKNQWELYSSNYEGSTVLGGYKSVEKLNRMDIKFNKNGSFTLIAAVYKANDSEKNEPNYEPYQGFYLDEDNVNIAGSWEFDSKDKTKINLSYNNQIVPFEISYLSRFSLTLKFKMGNGTPERTSLERN
ncbi:MAG: hypothetical protein ACI9XP_001401 [Lentimonas sp.]|jgi:hypothetical protein